MIRDCLTVDKTLRKTHSLYNLKLGAVSQGDIMFPLVSKKKKK